MSAFLGPIHYWLFNKIQLQDELTSSILSIAEQINNGKELQELLNLNYGSLEKGELADIIDENNIHGWLQDRISLVEKRLSYLVMSIVNSQPDKMKEISASAYDFGKKRALESGLSNKEAYSALDDLLLNGMPCDRVNEIIDESEEVLVWKQREDIHEKYWIMMNGNVEYYYEIKKNLIKGLLSNNTIEYIQLGEQKFELRKEA